MYVLLNGGTYLGSAVGASCGDRLLDDGGGLSAEEGESGAVGSNRLRKSSPSAATWSPIRAEPRSSCTCNVKRSGIGVLGAAVWRLCT